MTAFTLTLYVCIYEYIWFQPSSTVVLPKPPQANHHTSKHLNHAIITAIKIHLLRFSHNYISSVFFNNNNNNLIQRRYSRFFIISSQRRELSPTCTLKRPRRSRVQITCNTSSAYHVQHVVLRATWYEGTAQLLSLTELKSHLF